MLLCKLHGWNHSSIVDKSLHLAGYVGVMCTCFESEFASLLRGDLLKERSTLFFGVNSPFWYFTPLEWLTDGVKYTHFWSGITHKFLQCKATQKEKKKEDKWHVEKDIAKKHILYTINL